MLVQPLAFVRLRVNVNELVVPAVTVAVLVLAPAVIVPLPEIDQPYPVRPSGAL